MTNNEIYEELLTQEKANYAEITKLEREINEADYLTLRAEFANFKNEQQKIIASSEEIGKEEVITEIKKFIQTFNELLANEVGTKKFTKHLNKFPKEITKLIEEIGLEEVDCKTTLDPNFHYAVMMDSNPELDDDQITEVLQKGYVLEEVLVRPAMVKVNKK